MTCYWPVDEMREVYGKSAEFMKSVAEGEKVRRRVKGKVRQWIWFLYYVMID